MEKQLEPKSEFSVQWHCAITIDCDVFWIYGGFICHDEYPRRDLTYDRGYK